MKKICLLAPYKELLAFDEEENFLIKKYGNLSQVITIAKEFQKNGGEIIITRGGSAQILKENTSLKIIEVEISSYEIIKTLQKISDKEKPLGIVGYKNAVHKCSYLASILGFKNTFEIIYDQYNNYSFYIEELENLIFNKKINNFIGDTVLLNTLEKRTYYINFYLIESEYNSIHNAYNKAKILLDYQEKEKEKNLYYNLIFNNIDCGIILTSVSGNIIEFNSIINNFFTIEKNKNIFKLFPSFKDFFTRNNNEIILEVNLEKLIISLIDIDMNDSKNYIFVFRKIKSIENLVNISKAIKNENTNYTWKDILTTNTKYKETIEMAKSFAKTDENILITGDSGTGKELLAQSIHNESFRKNFPFITFNCANITESLIESELFGYSEGAFTGASKKGKKGIFELANHGTIFLDEISEIPYHLQSKFLRVLEEKKFRKVGGEEYIFIDVRIISACNQDLKELIKEKKFRKDLFYRLSTLELFTLPLKNRKEDIKYIGEHFIKKELINSPKYSIKDFEQILNIIETLDFPGNIRELKNLIKKIVILKTSLNFSTKQIIENITHQKNYSKEKNEIFPFENLKLKDIEKNIVSKILELENGNKSKTAIRLGIDRGKINRILKE